MSDPANKWTAFEIKSVLMVKVNDDGPEHETITIMDYKLGCWHLPPGLHAAPLWFQAQTQQYHFAI